MKAYLGKVLICVVPVAIACVIVGWAFYNYHQGKGTPRFQLGVDLVGGSILVYQVDPTKPGASSEKLDELAAALKRRIDPNDLYNVTIRPVPGDPPRVEIVLPTGGQGHGKGSLTEERIAEMQELIRQQGRLEFRILANIQDDPKPIEEAEARIKSSKDELARRNKTGDVPPPPSTKAYTITVNGAVSDHTYSWVEIGKEELYSIGLNNDAKNNPESADAWKEVAKARENGEAIRTSRLFRYSKTKDGKFVPVEIMHDALLYSREIPEERHQQLEQLSPKDKSKKYEYFVLTREESSNHKVVTGDYLDVGGVKGGIDDKGRLTVDFAFDSEGAILFGELTERNKPLPNKETGYKRHLAIILDGMVRSAPTLDSAIPNGRGQITGNFRQPEIEQLVRILRAGALPATLLPDPVAQKTMGATLGADTIRKGTYSVILAFAAVLIFMAVYYRFAGLVACFALLANLILTVAFMVLVSAAFTLPGLAGLVLMLGMAVDANILIYERLREERERGASLAMAIRNGYDRAFPTIIDTHLSSIFTAIVLYVVGNDQLKGFGISLTVGLIISLFTSLYITRTIFDIWMGNGWLRDLKFMHLFRRPNFDFMSIRYYWFTATIILTVLGGGLFLYRLDKGGLDIDFVGGTAYGGRFRQEVDLAQLRGLLEPLKDEARPPEKRLPDLSIEQTSPGDNPFSSKSRFFTVRTTEKDVKKVQALISEQLGKEWLEYVSMSWQPLPADSKEAQNLAKDGKRGYALTFRTPDDKEEAYASLYRVKTMLMEEIHRRAENARREEDGQLETALQARNFYVEPDSEKKEERYSKMLVTVSTDVPRTVIEDTLTTVADTFTKTPQPDSLENFDKQLAGNTQQRALVAIVLSWGAILLYLWFRFGSWTFGAAAVMCLIHDLFFTLGMIAGAHYIHHYVPSLASILLLQDFKINFATVAALLTLVGYSTNDTIVVFDRIREVRGKNPALTPQMINDSVNQTLSRTVLASLATWLVVVVLYFFGGDGVHLFSFVMVVGVIVGTYSSIYIASPLLLIFGEGVQKKAPVREREPQPTGSHV
jgi:SecD/SecF fusion protein